MTGINVLNMIDTHIDKQLTDMRLQREQLLSEVRALTVDISQLELHQMLLNRDKPMPADAYTAPYKVG